MLNKKFWIISGLLIAGAGATTAVASSLYHASKHSDFYGSYYDAYNVEKELLKGSGRGWWGRAPVTKDDFDTRIRERFARIDINSDNILDKDEIGKTIEGRMARYGRGKHRGQKFMQRVMRRFDVNKDGKVTSSERESRISKIFKRMDIDSNGQITDADLPPMLRGRKVLSGEGRFANYNGRHIRRAMRFLLGADINGDNVITRDEAQAAAAQRFARWDRNKDGQVDSSDIQSLRNEIISYRVKRFLHRFDATKGEQVTLDQFKVFYAERFARMDYDNNGELGRHEMRKHGKRLYKRMHDHRRGRYSKHRHHHEEFEPGFYPDLEPGVNGKYEPKPSLKEQSNNEERRL